MFAWLYDITNEQYLLILVTENNFSWVSQTFLVWFANLTEESLQINRKNNYRICKYCWLFFSMQKKRKSNEIENLLLLFKWGIFPIIFSNLFFFPLILIGLLSISLWWFYRYFFQFNIFKTFFFHFKNLKRNKEIY